jgi:cytosine/adenosine deaminase-related metal-dependent hydrolase
LALLTLWACREEASVEDDDDSTSATGGTAGTGGTGGQGGEATIVELGNPNHVLLRGFVLTPEQGFLGEVLIEGDVIRCVAESCANEPVAADASIVQTNGIILPGMIDAHNHILFDVFDESDWTPEQAYGNHNQWGAEARYSAMVDAKQHLNGESGTVDLNCELDKYGELKGLIAGTTSIVGAATPTNKGCYGSLARTIDQTSNGLSADKLQAHTLFPSASSADGVCTNFADGDTTAYLVHIAEGTDQTARDELEELRTVTTVDGCLFEARTSIVHGTAFGAAELDTIAAAGMGLVWSPRSNVFLYGSGTDLSKTTDVPGALMRNVRVALAPDWSIGGSQNLLDELRFADEVDATVWGDTLTPAALVDMVTRVPAELIGLDAELGRLAVGLKADVVVIGGDFDAAHASVIAATPREVRLVMVGGLVLYGDDQLAELGPADPGCETLDVCGDPKFLCVARPGGAPEDKLGQTFAEIQTALEEALSAYDAMNLSQWDFAPIAPLVRCP